MYKNHNWNKRQILRLENTCRELNKYMYMYKLREDIVFPHGYKTPSIVVVNDTIDQFLLSRKYIPAFVKPVKSFLKKIKNHDKIAVLDGKAILFNSYKLLQFIYMYVSLFEIQKDGTYKKTTFAYYKGDKSRYLKKYKKHCATLDEPDCTEEGSHKVMKFAYLFYSRSTEIIDAFFNQMALTPLHQLKELDNELYESKIIKKSAEFFSCTNFSSYKPLYKSLGIILVSYLINRMQIKEVDAIDYVNALFYDLFYDITNIDYQLNISAEKLLENVYITGRLDGIPIFASKDNEEAYSEEVLNGLEKLYTEMENDLGIDISCIDYKTFSPLKNLPSVYLNLTPMELLQPYM